MSDRYSASLLAKDARISRIRRGPTLSHQAAREARYPWYTTDTVALISDEGKADFDGIRPVKVVLTVHHINGNRKDNSHHNLIALCQRCHLRLDRAKHIAKRHARRIGGYQEVIPL